MTTLTYGRHGQTYSTKVEDLPAEAIAYLLQYGWAQSLQDSVAGRAKKVRDEADGESESEIVAMIREDEHGTMLKRFVESRAVAIDTEVARRMETEVGVGVEDDDIFSAPKDENPDAEENIPNPAADSDDD